MASVLSNYRAEIKNICKKFEVVKLEAFGSVLRDDFDPQKSDIDFVVNFKPAALDHYADNYFGLQHSLEELLQRPVELVSENAISNPWFLESVNRNKALIYEDRK